MVLLRKIKGEPMPPMYQLFLIMKLVVILVFLNLACVLGRGMGQQITLKAKNISLVEAMKSIKKQSGYSYFLNGKDLANIKVSAFIEGQNLTAALNVLLADKPAQWVLENETIVIKSKPLVKNKDRNTRSSFVSPSPSTTLQQRTISGKVINSNGEGLSGVNVIVKDTPIATVTNNEGIYSLIVPPHATILVFTNVGFKAQEKLINNQIRVDVEMEEQIDAIEDVVVVAFGAQKKSTMVGSVTNVNPKELKGPTSNLTTMLAGRVAGMIAYQRSGEPGRDNAQFFIRGVTTFGTGKVDPLILINGVEVGANDLARIQPDDIAGFSVLKDASAAALFGARGANGVVLVTTKSGFEGKTRFNVRYENSLSSNTRNFKLTDNITYMRLANEAVMTRDPLGVEMYSREKIERTMEGADPLIFPSNDWMDLMVKDNTLNHRLNLNMSGGGQKAQFYISGTANTDNGILKKIELNDFNTNVQARNYELRTNLNVRLTPSTEGIVRMQAQFDDYNGPRGGGGGIFKRIMWANPVKFPAIYDQSFQPTASHPLFGNAFIRGQEFYNQPYAYALSGYEQSRNSNMLAQIEIKQDLNTWIPGMNLRLMTYTRRNAYFSMSRSSDPFYYTSNFNSDDGFTGISLLKEGTGTEYLDYRHHDKIVNSFNWLETAVNYNRNIGAHDIGGMLISYLSDYQEGNASTLMMSLPQRNISLSGRATYGYNTKYLFEFNFGYNGSERFHVSNRFGFFPSIGVAWNLANESFFDKYRETVNKVKLRASYGLVGNDQIGTRAERFYYMSEVNLNSSSRAYTFGQNYDRSLDGIIVNRYANNDITWERAYKSNVALELGIMNNLNLEIDLFKEKRTNILSTRTYVPGTLGLSSAIKANIGEASSQGVDASLDFTKNYMNSSYFNFRGTFTYAASKQVVVDESEYPDGVFRSKVGKPIMQNFGLIAERYFVDEDEVENSPLQNYGRYMAGDIKYYDVNNDGQISDLDIVPIGYPTVPEVIYGFGFSYGFKSFDINAFFQGSARSSFWVDPKNIAPFIIHNGDASVSAPNSQNGLLQAIADNHWSEDNRDVYAFYPRLSSESVNNNYQTSTWWMRNGKFLRLKSVELGYNSSEKLNKSLGVSNMRIYTNAMNLFTWSKFRTWDIEMGGNGLGYPIQRVINMGILVGF